MLLVLAVRAAYNRAAALQEVCRFGESLGPARDARQRLQKAVESPGAPLESRLLFGIAAILEGTAEMNLGHPKESEAAFRAVLSALADPPDLLLKSNDARFLTASAERKLASVLIADPARADEARGTPERGDRAARRPRPRLRRGPPLSPRPGRRPARARRPAEGRRPGRRPRPGRVAPAGPGGEGPRRDAGPDAPRPPPPRPGRPILRPGRGPPTPHRGPRPPRRGPPHQPRRLRGPAASWPPARPTSGASGVRASGSSGSLALASESGLLGAGRRKDRSSRPFGRSWTRPAAPRSSGDQS